MVDKNPKNYFASPTLEETMALAVPTYFQLPDVTSLGEDFSGHKDIERKMDAILMAASGNLISTSQAFGKAMGVMGTTFEPQVDVPFSKEKRRKKIKSITSSDELEPYIAIFARVIGRDNEAVVQHILNEFDGMEMPLPKLEKEENPSAQTNAPERNEADFFVAPTLDDVLQIGMIHGLPTLAKLPPGIEKKQTIVTKMEELLQTAAQSDSANMSQFGRAMNTMQPSIPSAKLARYKEIRSLHTTQELKPYVTAFVRALAGNDEPLIQAMLDEFDGLPISHKIEMRYQTANGAPNTEPSAEREKLTPPSLDDVMEIPLPPYMKKRLHITIPDSAKNADTISDTMEALFLANKEQYQSHGRYNDFSREIAGAMSPPLRLASTRNVRYNVVDSITSSEEAQPHIASFVRTIARDNREVAQDILNLFEGITLPSEAMVAEKKRPVNQQKSTSADPDSTTTSKNAEISGLSRAAQIMKNLGLE